MIWNNEIKILCNKTITKDFFLVFLFLFVFFVRHIASLRVLVQSKVPAMEPKGGSQKIVICILLSLKQDEK